MTKFEFLGDLSRMIADLPIEDREQAMEYYEDYFADAGPEKEQEIIKDFISPAYIAEQLREASLQRRKEANAASFAEEEKRANQAMAAAAAEKPAVFSRKLGAQAQKAAGQSQPANAGASSATPSQPTAGKPMAQPNPQATQAAPQTGQTAATQAAPAQNAAFQSQQGSVPNVAAQAQRPPMPGAPQAPGQRVPAPGSPQTTVQRAPMPGTPQAAAQRAPMPGTAKPAASRGAINIPTPAKSADGSDKPSGNTMRNSIFRDESFADREQKEKELALKNKTKVDIKSINTSTSKVDKKQARARAKQDAENAKAMNAEMYSSSKKSMIAVVLVITCPIWLALLAAVLFLFVAGTGVIIGLVGLAIGGVIGGIATLLLSIMSLLTAHIPNFVFALGLALTLFAAGVGIGYLDFKLFTRVLPGAFFSFQVQLSNIRAKIARLAMK